MLTHRNCYINAYSFIGHLQVGHEDVEMWTLPMFHCNGWGGVYALTGQGGTHVVLRAVEGRKMYELMENYGVVRVYGTRCVAHNSRLSGQKPTHHQNQTKFTVAGALPGGVHRSTGERTWLALHSDLWADGNRAVPDLIATRLHDRRAGLRSSRSARAFPALVSTSSCWTTMATKYHATASLSAKSAHVATSCLRDTGNNLKRPTRPSMMGTSTPAIWRSLLAHYNVHIVDRKKDVIISGGENISSPEIEDALYKHPAVLECAVIGVPHEKWGETPKALIVLREGSNVGEAQMIEFCRDHLAHFKCPTSVEFIEALPRTATGKLQKFRLREEYWDGQRKVAG